MLRFIEAVVSGLGNSLGSVMKSVPLGDDLHQNERMLREIERVAETSPHLLSDLGFVEDKAQACAGIQVWRRGAIAVTVVRGQAQAQAHVRPVAQRHDRGHVMRAPVVSAATL